MSDRCAPKGLDSENGTYASFVAAQNMRMQKHLLDTSSGLFWHGADAKAGVHSCCKWGRANGWTLMSSAEVLAALYASSTPAAIAARPAALAAFQAHAAALTKVQNSDGRWHQVLDNQTTFLETSCTAMYTVAIVTGINAGWLDNATYSPVVVQAWAGPFKGDNPTTIPRKDPTKPDCARGAALPLPSNRGRSMAPPFFW